MTTTPTPPEAPTPETDGFAHFTIEGVDGYLVRAKDARTLERQRDEAQKWLAINKDQRLATETQLEEALRQLKETVEELEQATVGCVIAENARDTALAEVATLREQLELVKDELRQDANFGTLVQALWDSPLREAEEEIERLRVLQPR